MFLKLVSIKFFADNDGVINIKKPALHVFFYGLTGNVRNSGFDFKLKLWWLIYFNCW